MADLAGGLRARRRDRRRAIRRVRTRPARGPGTPFTIGVVQAVVIGDHVQVSVTPDGDTLELLLDETVGRPQIRQQIADQLLRQDLGSFPRLGHPTAGGDLDPVDRLQRGIRTVELIAFEHEQSAVVDHDFGQSDPVTLGVGALQLVAEPLPPAVRVAPDPSDTLRVAFQFPLQYHPDGITIDGHSFEPVTAQPGRDIRGQRDALFDTTVGTCDHQFVPRTFFTFDGQNESAPGASREPSDIERYRRTVLGDRNLPVDNSRRT